MNGNTVQIPSEKLIELIVREVVSELARRGVAVGLPTSGDGQVVPVGGNGHDPATAAACPRRLEIDFTDYKTPVLTEHHVRSAGRDVREIIVPAGTVCTIGARDLLQQRHLTLTTNGKKH